MTSKKSAVLIEHERVMREGTRLEKLDHIDALLTQLRETLEDWGEIMEKRKERE